MEYCLFTAWDCTVYKKEPLVRVFFGDRLIDEYNIPCNNHKFINFCDNEWKKKIQSYHVLQPGRRPDEFFYKFPIPLEILLEKTFYKIYKINLHKTLDIQLKIEIENNDNNYSNGFLNKMTLVSLVEQFLMPINKNYIKDLIMRRHRYLIENYRMFKDIKSAYRNFDYFETKELGEKILKNDLDKWQYSIGKSGYFITQYCQNSDNFLSKKNINQFGGSHELEKVLEYINRINF
jgi:hypothetical protein